MTSSVHPKDKTKYHVGNWPASDRALVQRGDVTLWLAPEAITPWAAAGVGQRGGPRQYSDLAIATARTLRRIFPLPLRQTEGFLTSIFWMLDLDLSAPDHTPRSRRGQHLDPTVRRAPADAAYDTVAFYESAGARDAQVVVPPATPATVSRRGPRSSARDRTIKQVKEIGRRRWKKASASHQQARVEHAFFRYKSIFGGARRARSPAGQVAEALVACTVLNQMTDLGRPDSYAIGR